MSIEEPRKLVMPDDGGVDSSDYLNQLEKEQFTIGFVYDEIKRSLRYLSGKKVISFGNEDKQIQGWSNPGDLEKVSSLHDAIKGINEIEAQGEGTSARDPTDGSKDPGTGLPELAHYYKFAEIVYGKRIVFHDDGAFSYSGEEIPFDEDGIYNMVDDPDISLLKQGSKARLAAENFSRRYQALLNGLHRTFNGEPQYITQAIASMFQLTIFAEPLMKMEDGLWAGRWNYSRTKLPTPDR